MSTETEQQPQRERSVIYIITVVVLVVLTVIALVTFLSARQEVKAQDKAEQFLASARRDPVVYARLSDLAVVWPLP